MLDFDGFMGGPSLCGLATQPSLGVRTVGSVSDSLEDLRLGVPQGPASGLAPQSLE